MDASINKKRYGSLICVIFIEAMAGLSYAWSVFAGLWMQKYGWSAGEMSISYVVGAITGLVVSFFLGASFRKWFTVKQEVFIGSVLYAGGMLLDAINPGSIWLLYFFHSFIITFGNTMVYPPLMAYIVEIFPEKTGVASGLAASGYGIGAVFWAPLAVWLHELTGDVQKVYLVMGIGFMILMCGLSLLLIDPKDVHVDMSQFTQKKKTRRLVESPYNIGKKDMMKTSMFYFIMVCFICIYASGNMIISQCSLIMQNTYSMTAAAAATIVSILSICNTLGRLFWGTLSDRVGKTNTALVIEAVLIVVMFMLFVIKQQAVFTVFLVAVGFLYGGAATILSATTGEVFGIEHTAENYSVTYCAFGIASFIGPSVMGILIDKTGKYTPGFLYGACLAAIGFVCMVLARIIMTKKVNENRKLQAQQ